MSRLWMISYDIEDDRVRRRVHDLLKDHGVRVQFSVFECWLDSRQVAGLRIRVRRAIQDTDRVLWYPLCTWCKRSIDWHGQGLPAEDADFHLL